MKDKEERVIDRNTEEITFGETFLGGGRAFYMRGTFWGVQIFHSITLRKLKIKVNRTQRRVIQSVRVEAGEVLDDGW